MPRSPQKAVSRTALFVIIAGLSLTFAGAVTNASGNRIVDSLGSLFGFNSSSFRGLFPNPTTTIFINEIHYDNAGTDTAEGVEIAGPAGTDLTGWTLVPYNGNGGATYTPIVSLTGIIPNQQNGYGTLNFGVLGLQNGSPDGIALVNGSTVVQFLCYEGTFSATNGPASGMTCTDIGIAEEAATIDFSLQLIGTGSTYGDFTWTGPVTNSRGEVNAGQTFTTSASPTPTATFTPTPTPTFTPTPTPTFTPTPTPTFTPTPTPLAEGTYVVNTTEDSDDGSCNTLPNGLAPEGEQLPDCTLREAINAANTDEISSTIVFNIPEQDPAFGGPETGVMTIAPVVPLPAITAPVVIDGYTQPGASPNTLSIGNNAVILIELRGDVSGGSGLVFLGGGSTLRGLVINRFAVDGVSLRNLGGNTIAGNFIGTDPTGAAVFGNVIAGVHIDDSSSNNIIGGTSPADRNVIAGSIFGVLIRSGTNGQVAPDTADVAAGNQVLGNYIGTNAAGTAPLGNTNGVGMQFGPQNTMIGGTEAGAGNLISGNSDTGISVSESQSTYIQGNLIGTDATGTSAIPNLTGIRLGRINILNGPTGTDEPSGFSFGVLIGGVGFGNVISGNLGDGIHFVDGSFIFAQPEGENGVPQVAANTVQGNLIGTASNGTTPLGNGGNGIRVESQSSPFPNAPEGGVIQSGTLLIGGVESGEGNVIAHNGGNGVVVVGTVLLPFRPEAPTSLTGNRISGNSIHSNLGSTNGQASPTVVSAGLGIDLGANGVTLNDAQDPDVGPNNLQNYPVLSSAVVGPPHVISGSLNTVPETSDYQIEFFANASCDPSGFGEGQIFLGHIITGPTDASGNVNFSFNPPTLAGGQFITATATDVNGNTSEFSQCIVAVAPVPTPTPTPTPEPCESGTFSNPTLIEIPAFGSASPYPSTITVSGMPAISDVYGNLQVHIRGFSHTSPDNVGIVLVGPTGTAFLLQDGVGDSTDMVGVTYHLSDAGVPQLPDTGSWPTGFYRPAAYYAGSNFPEPGPGTSYANPGPAGGGNATFGSVFSGTNPNGVWSLYVYDFASGESGSISGGWGLEIIPDCGQPSPPVVIAGNIQQYGDGGPNTDLQGVTVTLSGTVNGSTTTDANGNYSFVNLPSGGTYTVTPSGLDRSYDPDARTYTALASNVLDANFVAFGAPGVNRNLAIGTVYVTDGDPVSLPVTLTGLGNETSIRFSLNYDFNPLSLPGVTCGSAAPACLLTVDTSTPGRIGVIVTLAAPLPAGANELVRVNFQSLETSLPSTPVTFGDTPTPRATRDALNNPLPTTYTNGLIVFAQGLESDVAPRKTGDGLLLANDLPVIRQFIVGSLTPDPLYNEFQRADSAPLNTLGDGILDAGDIVQARRYVVGLDFPRPAGGPGAPILNGEVGQAPSAETETVRRLKVTDVAASAGSSVVVPITLDAVGGESAVSFSLRFDPSRLAAPVFELSSGLPHGTVLTFNNQRAGEGIVSVLIDSIEDLSGTPGSSHIASIRFEILPSAPFGTTGIDFTDDLASPSVAGRSGHVLTAAWGGGTVAISSPNAASISVSGRVIDPNGASVRNARVTLTDGQGVSRSVETSAFGYYRFDVAANGTYNVAVQTKRFRFASRSVMLSGDLTGIDFVAME